ncbi:MAG: hypothetical protein NTW80_09965 [Deltaproteobacteria bacterium]|nr:hypothetical protein [Deltaproteobacteria bacterium]
MAKIPQATLQQQFKTINYIGLAMMAAVFMYAVIVLSIDKGYLPYKAQPGANIGAFTTIKYILLGLSILQYFAIKFFQKFSLKSAAYLPAGAIITFALCEAVSIYGLVLFFLTGNANSLLYFYLFYPKYSDWEKLWLQGLSKNKSA